MDSIQTTVNSKGETRVCFHYEYIYQIDCKIRPIHSDIQENGQGVDIQKAVRLLAP